MTAYTQAGSRALARALFAPRSVALIGLSNDPSRPTGRVLRYLGHGGFAGRVHVVNPRRDMVQGVPAAPAVAALPEVPEHAYVLLGTDLAERAVADQVASGALVRVPVHGVTFRRSLRAVYPRQAGRSGGDGRDGLGGDAEALLELARRTAGTGGVHA